MSKSILSQEQAQAIAAAIIAGGQHQEDPLALIPDIELESIVESPVKKRGRPARKKAHDELNGDPMELENYPLDLVDSWVSGSGKNKWSDDA
jgi:hypothetical protein